MAIIFSFVWAGPLAFNSLFAVGRILDRREDGVSPLPIIGSLCGAIALLIAPLGVLGERLLLLPLGLLPDLIPLVEGRVHAWRRRNSQ